MALDKQPPSFLGTRSPIAAFILLFFAFVGGTYFIDSVWDFYKTGSMPSFWKSFWIDAIFAASLTRTFLLKNRNKPQI